jgi:VWFA-related protein
MKFLPFSALLWLALAAPVASLPAAVQRPSPATPPSFGETLDVDVVNVDVYVTGKDGRRVSGLRQEDFVVAEDGKPVAVTNFAAMAREPAPTSAAIAAAGAAGAGAGAPGADPASELYLVVFVDNLHLHPANRTRALEQIRKFLLASIRPSDHVLLATYDVGLKVRRPFTGDTAAIDGTLREIERLPTYGQQEDSARLTAYQAMLTLNSIDPCGVQIVKPIEGYAEERRGEALRTVGTLTLMINSLAGLPGRKAFLYVSDGVSISPGEELFEAVAQLCGAGGSDGTALERGGRGAGDDLAKYQPQQASLDAMRYNVAKRFEDLAAHASANRVTFYTLQASGLEAPTLPIDIEGSPAQRLIGTGALQLLQSQNRQASLTALAADTGGRAMVDANDFAPGLARMQEDFETYYSLGYSPAHRGDGQVHKVVVKLKRPGLQVRYRRSYRDKPAAERMVDRTLAALLHGAEANPLDLQVEIGEPVADGKQYAVPVQLKIPLFKLALLNQQDIYRGRLGILVATREDDGGGISAVRRVEVPLAIPRSQVLNAMGQLYLYTLTLKMKAGPQHVAIAVRDEIAAASSYLSRPVTVGPVRASAAGHL